MSEPTTPAASDRLTRVTVNLIPCAVAALDASTARTGHTKTDTINRAIQVYELVQRLIEQGGGSMTVLASDGTRDRVTVL